MTKRTIFLATLSIITTLALLSCKKENISKADSNNSHHKGENCMTCHTSGGEGKGIFTVAGTVYNVAKTSTVENPILYLFSQPNGGGNLLLTLKGDLNGNCYTTQGIDLSSGVYPGVTRVGDVKYMSTPVTTGACNSCHGITTDKLWAN